MDKGHPFVRTAQHVPHRIAHIAGSEHHPPYTLPREPVEQPVQEGPRTDGCERLWHIAHHRAQASPKSSGEDDGLLWDHLPSRGKMADSIIPQIAWPSTSCPSWTRGVLELGIMTQTSHKMAIFPPP